MLEVWKEIPWTDGRYSASSLGRIRGNDRTLANCLGVVRHYKEKVKSTYPDRSRRGKYMKVGVSVEGHASTCVVHRLVLEAFVGPRPEGLEGRHVNGDCQDNRIENLVWGTSAENAEDKRLHGRTIMGEAQINAVLSPWAVRVIRRLHGRIPQVEICKIFGVYRSTVYKAAHGVSWRQVLSPPSVD